jgi:transposase-like protein
MKNAVVYFTQQKGGIMIHIAQEQIKSFYECQDCKKTFSGEYGLQGASIHCLEKNHNVIGKATYFVAITTKQNRPDAA